MFHIKFKGFFLFNNSRIKSTESFPLIIDEYLDLLRETDLRVLLDPPFLEGTITHSQVVLLDPGNRDKQTIQFDPKIERTLKKLKKQAKIQQQQAAKENLVFEEVEDQLSMAAENQIQELLETSLFLAQQ
ncbi:hypothetical protein PIB30_075329, partial [Stylosanthes scabra]|nr:hypothetical protein [Stylosanthes scabra]